MASLSYLILSTLFTLVLPPIADAATGEDESSIVASVPLPKSKKVIRLTPRKTKLGIYINGYNVGQMDLEVGEFWFGVTDINLNAFGAGTAYGSPLVYLAN